MSICNIWKNWSARLNRLPCPCNDRKHSIQRSQFKMAVISALFSVISLPLFKDMVLRNWYNKQGNEEEMYPYFTEALRRSFGRVVLGIGPGKIPNRIEKVDCLVDLSTAIYSVELKGPSRDHSYITRGMAADFKKISSLVSNSDIDFGISIGIFIEKLSVQHEYRKVFVLNGESIGVRIEVKETEHKIETTHVL